MTLAIAYTLTLLVVALALFAWERLSVDVVGLLLLLLLTVPGVLSAEEALAGFGNPTVLALICLFVLTAGVVRTGVVERLGLRLAALGGNAPQRLVRPILAGVTAVSGLLSNTVTTAAFLPIVAGIARRGALSLSRVLMPLAFASVLASGLTLVATSTNLLVSGQLAEYGLREIGFFEMSPLGIILVAVGLPYLMYVAPRLLPERASGEAEDRYHLRRYLCEAVITPGSRLADRALGESGLGQLHLTVVGLVRGGERLLAPGPRTRLLVADVLMIEGEVADVLAVKDAVGIEIRPEIELSRFDLTADDVRIVEAMVLPQSRFVGRTIRSTRFRERTGLTVLAVHSAGGADAASKLSHRRLEPSDVLLLQGHEEDFGRVRRDELLLLEDVSAHHPRSRKGPLAGGVFLAALLAGSAGLLPLPIALIAGAVTLVLTRCLTPQEAYSAVDWRLIVMIACMISFGAAIESTGTAQYLADLVVRHVSPYGGRALLAAFFLVTVALSQAMSNQAAALVVLPVAIFAATALGLEPRSLAMTVTFAASCSFLTPLEPACLLVYGPGRYRFFDFTRVGAPLTLLVFALTIWLIPVLWPLGG